MVAMPAEDVLGASAAPELDEYGVPVQPPPKTHAYLRLTISLLITSALLVLEALSPHGLTWCHNACGDGGYLRHRANLEQPGAVGEHILGWIT